MKLLKSTFLFVTAVLAFSACKKTAVTEPLNGAGQTLVKFVFTDAEKNPNGIPDTADGKRAGYQLFNVDLAPKPQTLEVADLRRDVPNNTELNRPMTIVIENDPGAVHDYDPALVSLPDGSYTTDPRYTYSGNSYTITMAPGEIAKTLKITIPDITTLDLNKKYGLGFTISTVDADGHISAMQKTLVVEIGTKNKWDGVYAVSGDFAGHPTACLLGTFFSDATDGGPVRELELITIGSSSVRRNLPGAVGESFAVWNHCTSILTYFTAVIPRYQINSNNSITILDGPGAAVTWDNRGSSYDPATKTFNLHYGYNGSRVINETFRYLRAR